jgi:hypothetical protein
MRSTVVLLAGLAVARVAAAQPSPPQPPPPPVDTPPGTPEPTPPPPPTPPPTPPPPPTKIEPAPEHERPEGLSFAIGVGYEFKTSLETPNIVSARVRFSSGLTLEPVVVVSNQSSDMQSQPAPTVSTSRTELALGSLVRFPLIKHGRTDFELIGSALLDTVKVNPDGPDNDTSTSTLDVAWGIGIGFWITHHWQVSFTATNPLITYTNMSQQTGPSTSDTTKTTTFGLVFDPTVALMIHLYN